MSNLHNEAVRERLLDKITSMTVDQFQNACEKYGLLAESSVIDEYVSHLLEAMFENPDHLPPPSIKRAQL